MNLERKLGFYERYVKRALDIICSLFFIVFFFWLYVIIAIIVRIKLGNPVLFRQPRPGIVKNGKESIIYIYKFRSMTNEKDENGNLLPDHQRLPKFGMMLRSTSLDELPEILSILKGDMSFVGPRPQLVRDMVFMTNKQRMRHTAKPGLTGLAQIKGRNAISWEDKLNWDLKYIEKITFWGDVKILIGTVFAIIKRSGITDGENATALDYGDALLKAGMITQDEYNRKQKEAKRLLGDKR